MELTMTRLLQCMYLDSGFCTPLGRGTIISGAYFKPWFGGIDRCMLFGYRWTQARQTEKEAEAKTETETKTKEKKQTDKQTDKQTNRQNQRQPTDGKRTNKKATGHRKMK